jgi:hypothetical protein
MYFRPLKRSFFICWMVLFLALNSGLQGLVLCFGSDGHKALEPEHQGTCRQRNHPFSGGTFPSEHETIVGNLRSNVFCKDVHFHLDRIENNSSNRQRNPQNQLFSHTIPHQASLHVPVFLWDRNEPAAPAPARSTPSIKNPVLRC